MPGETAWETEELVTFQVAVSKECAAPVEARSRRCAGLREQPGVQSCKTAREILEGKNQKTHSQQKTNMPYRRA